VAELRNAQAGGKQTYHRFFRRYPFVRFNQQWVSTQEYKGNTGFPLCYELGEMNGFHHECSISRIRAASAGDLPVD